MIDIKNKYSFIHKNIRKKLEKINLFGLEHY